MLAHPAELLQAVMCVTADPGDASSILAQSHAFIDHEIISMAILLPSADSRRVVVSYKGNFKQYYQSNLLNYLPPNPACFPYKMKHFMEMLEQPLSKT